ncbi:MULTISPECIES: HDOD domain-containing protein [unclassified Photobacterium]|uniref:HDOD domain-containing protein n=1 Tax=unclassified Photobacterium TaxID=2628852 RepID=UPI001EE0FCA4|nr:MULTISPECIES: HDOD domain-containing protein [unclassified Photobacterium]MCG3863110.1 HDOD domain-containing protein [Photobacterium sp. Ph6]MCG3874640.1 HDOD domain-containing protein [Photobacterium sp. Ph5]
MSHLSFFWLKHSRDHQIKALESEFCNLVKQSAQQNKLELPPIPDVLIKLHQLCNDDETTIHDVADLLLDDPALTATIIRTSNTVLFNRRNVICNDLLTAVSRLGLLRVRDIATAQAITELRKVQTENLACNQLLSQSAIRSRQFAGTMALICQSLIKHSEKPLKIEPEKALLTGLLADIGVFSLIYEYLNYIENDNYLDIDIAKYIFQETCKKTSLIVLKEWGFDNDYLEIASNKRQPYGNNNDTLSYLDIARMAHHLLLFKNNDDAIDENDVELDLVGAEVMYELTNLPTHEFNQRVKNVVRESGF